MDNQYLHNFNLGKKYLFSFLIIIFSAFLLSLTIWIGAKTQNTIEEGKYINQKFEPKNTITISAHSEIYAKPDLALVVASIINDAKTVSEAMASNTKSINAVIAFAKSQGVDAKDLKTTNFSIYPRYEWQTQKVCVVPPCPSGKRVLIGYEVNQSLQIKIRDMAKIGNIVQGITEAGANRINNLSFSIAKKDELQKKVRDEAIKKAKAKAKDLASKLGIQLVKITRFTENNIPPIYPYPQRLLTAGTSKGDESNKSIPQIETGANKIEANVSITYEMN